jgi:hypothetical protein
VLHEYSSKDGRGVHHAARGCAQLAMMIITLQIIKYSLHIATACAFLSTWDTIFHLVVARSLAILYDLISTLPWAA